MGGRFDGERSNEFGGECLRAFLGDGMLNEEYEDELISWGCEDCGFMWIIYNKNWTKIYVK